VLRLAFNWKLGSRPVRVGGLGRPWLGLGVWGAVGEHSLAALACQCTGIAMMQAGIRRAQQPASEAADAHWAESGGGDSLPRPRPQGPGKPGKFELWIQVKLKWLELLSSSLPVTGPGAGSCARCHNVPLTRRPKVLPSESGLRLQAIKVIMRSEKPLCQ
jgi:hypothetical protein